MAATAACLVQAKDTSKSDSCNYHFQRHLEALKITLRLGSLLSNIKHLLVDVKDRNMTPLLLVLLVLLMHRCLRYLLVLGWLLLGHRATLLLFQLFSCSNGPEHPERHITSTTCDIKMLHAREGA